MTEYQTLNDGCEGDAAGLKAALGDYYTVLYEHCDDQGWGHHSYNAVFQTSDGRYIAANCGGCSCYGNGDWNYASSKADAMRYVPEESK